MSLTICFIHMKEILVSALLFCFFRNFILKNYLNSGFFKNYYYTGPWLEMASRAWLKKSLPHSTVYKTCEHIYHFLNFI